METAEQMEEMLLQICKQCHQRHCYLVPGKILPMFLVIGETLAKDG